MIRGLGWLRAARSWWRNERGQGLVEYCLILALASVGLGVALLMLRDSVGNTMAQTSNRIDSASTSGISGVVVNQPGGGSSGGSTGTAGGGGSSGGNGNGNGNNGSGNNGNGSGTNGNGNGNSNGNGNGSGNNGNGSGSNGNGHGHGH